MLENETFYSFKVFSFRTYKKSTAAHICLTQKTESVKEGDNQHSEQLCSSLSVQAKMRAKKQKNKQNTCYYFTQICFIIIFKDPSRDKHCKLATAISAIVYAM
ncbi:hypothetical protein AMECASPLE_033267 [Ameca splendens]|uniref:Uncharacterized protein n=1 Tax=Ameca splendens TaxID=208324 RepID=A0ABV0XVQ9_9TELE